MYLCSLVCSVNSTLTTLDVSNNPMSAAASKAIELEFVLCQMRNPTVTKIKANSKGFDDHGAIKIGEGMRFVLHIISWLIRGPYQGVSLCLNCSQNHTLTELNLSENQIGDAGATSIGGALAYVTLSFCK
jgi:hypothetical protein